MNQCMNWRQFRSKELPWSSALWFCPDRLLCSSHYLDLQTYIQINRDSFSYINKFSQNTRIVTLFNKHSGVQAIIYSDSYSHQTSGLLSSISLVLNTKIIRWNLRSMLCCGAFQCSSHIERVPALSLPRTKKNSSF
jgi:hypothetical protein